MEPTHKSGNIDDIRTGQDIFRSDGYSFYDELSDTEVIKHPVFTAGINQDLIYSMMAQHSSGRSITIIRPENGTQIF